MTRHEERETVFSLLYEYTFYEDTDAGAFYFSREKISEKPFSEYVMNTFFGVATNVGDIDGIITEYSVGWKVKRMSRVTRSILRLAVFELKYTDTPPKAVINEAVELSKTYDDDKAPGFINGILNKYARDNQMIGEEA